MRYWGFTDARVTASGPDGGIDVNSSDAVAQVKFNAHAVGAPAVQQLFGARGTDTAKRLLFFTGTSYSAKARGYAEQVGMALFAYDLLGQPTAKMGAVYGVTVERIRQVEGRAMANLSHTSRHQVLVDYLDHDYLADDDVPDPRWWAGIPPQP